MIEVKNIKLDALNDDIYSYINNKFKVSKYKIIKRSIDARDKNNINIIYDVALSVDDEDKYINNKNIFKYEEVIHKLPSNVNKKDVVVVGSGPSGLFCALSLIYMGCNVTIIERGKDVDSRSKDIEQYFKTGKLDRNSNVLYGEGGAGTFSDGKLTCNIKNKEHYKEFVFNEFVKFGAPSEILYDYLPHIGTDNLVNILKNIRKFIIENGGVFRFNTLLTDIFYDENGINSIEVNYNEQIQCDNLVLAIGHSSMDTFEMLYNNKINMESKPFAVGVRCIHNQDMIDFAQYGGKYRRVLYNSSYKLTYTTKEGRGVYSFCMCPGGYVISSSDENGKMVCNGMSNYNRDSTYANSAIIVTVGPNDYGQGVFDGFKFQRSLEAKAYYEGQGAMPIQFLKDYFDNKKSIEIRHDGIKGLTNSGNLNNIFPDVINNSLKEGFKYFGRVISGFDRDDTILAGVESRTSSPVRVNRNDTFECNIKGVYPIGEGAGYAGGITSSAIDGVKAAEFIATKN